uniref:Amidase domain-containing protein n=1 Tax=Panagrellus redivivus TaxID=6233 RepID=A0A7E4ZXB9_PANRE
MASEAPTVAIVTVDQAVKAAVKAKGDLAIARVFYSVDGIVALFLAAKSDGIVPAKNTSSSSHWLEPAGFSNLGETFSVNWGLPCREKLPLPWHLYADPYDRYPDRKANGGDDGRRENTNVHRIDSEVSHEIINKRDLQQHQNPKEKKPSLTGEHPATLALPVSITQATAETCAINQWTKLKRGTVEFDYVSFYKPVFTPSHRLFGHPKPKTRGHK